MHWWKLSIFLSKSLVLCATGIFRIGVTTKDPNITAISTPWRKCPYRDRNANVHLCNAKTLRWELLRWRHCIFHSHLKSWSLDWHARIFEWAMMVYFKHLWYRKRANSKKYITRLKTVGWDTCMYVFMPLTISDFVVYTLWESDPYRHFSKKGSTIQLVFTN